MNRTTLCALMLVATAGLLIAGPLSPPAGSVAPTYKTLADVEPRIALSASNTPGDADSMFRILNAGSYYLTDILLVGPGKAGIEIATDDVTIDLNGFRIGGIAGTLDGIRITGTNHRNITIRNGIIEHLQGDGINLLSDSGITDTRGCHLENLTIADCTLLGIRLSSGTLVESCSVLNNASGGIVAAAPSANTGCVIRSCIARGNGINGGILPADHAVVENCMSENNAGDGIFVLDGSLVVGCACSGNASDGIEAESSTISGCTASGNSHNGILARSNSVIRGNNAFGNGVSGSGAGIAVGLSGTRIEGNNLVGNVVGLQVLGSANVIVANTASGNSPNYSIVASNRYGPIVNLTASGAAAASGNAAASTLTSTDPFANFAY